MIGRWAICGHGRLARITSYNESVGGPIYNGVRLDNGRSWRSRMPATIHPRDAAVLDATFPDYGADHAV